MISVYKITNLINSKCYIGISSNPTSRWGTHLSCAKTHRTDCPKLYRAINKYGAVNFSFEIIDTADTRPQAFVLERHYISHFNAIENGMNIDEGGVGSPLVHARKKKGSQWPKGSGKPLSEETKKRMKESAKRGKDNPLYGKPRSIEVKQKISKAQKGKKLTAEHRKKLSEARRRESNSANKLNWKLICDIRNEYANEETVKHLALKYKVSERHILRIVNNEIWTVNLLLPATSQ